MPTLTFTDRNGATMTMVIVGSNLPTPRPTGPFIAAQR